MARRRLHARWDEITQLLVSELDLLGNHDEASAVVETLLRGDLQPVAPHTGRDPLRQAFVRAIHCQGDRDTRLALADPGPRLARDWQRWRDEVVGRPTSHLSRRYLNHALFSFGAAAYPLMDDLRQQARDTDPDARRPALWALHALAAADLPGARQVFEAAEAEVGSQGSFLAGIDELRAMLRSPEPSQRQFAAARLGRLGAAATSAVDDLRPLLADTDPTVRMIVPLALGQIGPAAASAVPDLLRQADWTTPSQYSSLVRAIGAIGPAAIDASDTLIHVVLHPPQGGQLFGDLIGNTLRQTGLTPPARQALLDALAPTTDPTVRVRALSLLSPLAATLGLCRETLLQLALRDPQTTAVSLSLGQALARQAPDAVAQTVDELRQVLRAGNSIEMNRALLLLGAMGSAAGAAVNDLRAILASDDVLYWPDAATALGNIGRVAAPAIGELLQNAVRVTDPAPERSGSNTEWQREIIIQTLGRIGVGSPEVVAMLRQSLRDPQDGLRLVATNAVDKISPPALAAVPDLLHLLDEPGRTPAAEVTVALNVLLPQVTDAFYDPAFRVEDEDRSPTVSSASSAGTPSKAREETMPAERGAWWWRVWPFGQ